MLEKLFQMGSGYVLDFSDRMMGEFFALNLDIDIYEDLYNYGSGSKANRMRGFWNEADDSEVGTAILQLVDYIETKILIEEFAANAFNPKLIETCKQIGQTLVSSPYEDPSEIGKTAAIKDFLSEDFDDITTIISELEIDIQAVVSQRMDEIVAILEIAPLAAIFLIGSTLEGVLVDLALKHASSFSSSPSAPVRDSVVHPLQSWKLNSLINVAFELEYLGEDVKKFSHVVREFRNYIHPRAQANARFNPTIDSAKICFQVLKAALSEINRKVQEESSS